MCIIRCQFFSNTTGNYSPRASLALRSVMFKYFLRNNTLVVLFETHTEPPADENPNSMEIHWTLGQSNLVNNYMVDSAQKDCDVICFHQSSTFAHTFNNGCRTKVKMSYFNTLRFREYDIRVDELFRSTLPGLLAHRMSRNCAANFLQSLRASLITPQPHVKGLMVSNNLPYDEHCEEKCIETIVRAVANLSAEKIALLERINCQNALHHGVSPNVFNFHQNENKQQNALSIKKSNLGGRTSNVNSNYGYVKRCLLEGVDFTPGRVYVTENTTYTIISLTVDDKILLDMIAKNMVVCFRKHETPAEIVNCSVEMYVRDDVFPELSKMQIKHKLIQFSILQRLVEHLPADVKFFTTIQNEVWQSGCPMLLKAVTFSPETMASNSKNFEIYGVFCHDFLLELCRKYGPTITVRRIIEIKKNRQFFYCLISLNLKYKHVLCEEVVDRMGRQCVPLSACRTLVEAHQAARKCCTLIYHTFFKWFNRALKDVDLRAVMDQFPGNNFRKNVSPLFGAMPCVRVLAQNLINYNYINTTKDTNIYPDSSDDQITMAQIIIETKKNITRSILVPWIESTLAARRISTSMVVKNTPFDGSFDGPLVNAVSVRTCEKITDPRNAGKEWECAIVNLSMLTNNPEFRGTESEANCIKFHV